MPRIAFITLQLALAVGIVLAGLSIFEKYQRAGEIAPAPATASSQASTDPMRDERTKPLAHYQIIARRNLFRTPTDEEPAAPTIDIEALEPTQLKLKLWGTITGEDGMTRAVIEDQTKRKQDFYRAGDEVSTAKVKMILREKVILSVNGEDQILEIEKPASTGRRAPAMQGNLGETRPRGAPPSASRSSASRAPTRRAIRVKLSRLGSISENPEDWSSYAAATPYDDDEGENGLRLSKITPSSPLRRLGIRNGDVVMAINDQPVAALDDLVKPLAEISAGEEMSLQIKRRGRERKLDFKFE
jgi:general secretion pathway protein C